MSFHTSVQSRITSKWSIPASCCQNIGVNNLNEDNNNKAWYVSLPGFVNPSTHHHWWKIINTYFLTTRLIWWHERSPSLNPSAAILKPDVMTATLKKDIQFINLHRVKIIITWKHFSVNLTQQLHVHPYEPRVATTQHEDFPTSTPYTGYTKKLLLAEPTLPVWHSTLAGSS